MGGIALSNRIIHQQQLTSLREHAFFQLGRRGLDESNLSPLSRLSREVSPPSSNASAVAAAAAAAAASQSVQPSSHIQRSIPGQSVVSNHGLTPFQQSKLRSSSSSPPPNKLSSQQQHASRRSPPTSDSPNTGCEERFDLDEDVDVEQCSDGEDESRSAMDTKHSSNGLSDPRSPGGDATASSNNNDETYSGRETSSSTS